MRLPALIGIVSILSALYQFSGPLPPLRTDAFPPGRVLVLTAHPDDETMFFGPAVVGLTSEKRREVWAVCMSTGDAAGLGKQRRKELLDAYGALGVKPSKLDILDHPELKDGMKTQWDPKLIASLVQQTINAYAIDIVITFDSLGVSSHPNHASLSPASLLLRPSPSSSTPKTPLKIYHLTSPSHPLKYTSFLPSLLSRYSPPTPPNVLRERRLRDGGKVRVVRTAVGAEGWERLVRAMRKHVSQMVWFRWVYLGFSRLMFEGEYRLVQG